MLRLLSYIFCCCIFRYTRYLGRTEIQKKFYGFKLFKLRQNLKDFFDFAFDNYNSQLVYY